jgi:hypothetical protein
MQVPMSSICTRALTGRQDRNAWRLPLTFQPGLFVLANVEICCCSSLHSVVARPKVCAMEVGKCYKQHVPTPLRYVFNMQTLLLSTKLK